MAGNVGKVFRQRLSSETLLEENITDTGNDTEPVSSDESTGFSQMPFSAGYKRKNRDPEEVYNSRQKSPSEWSISDVKQWVTEIFESEDIAANFESEEVDGAILMSQTITTAAAMEKLGLNTIGKKGKFLGKIKQLSGEDGAGYEDKAVVKKPRLVLDFADLDRVLINKEKDRLTCSDRSVYNTKKKRIVDFAKTVWPIDKPAPWFRNNASNVKTLSEVVLQLSKDEAYTFVKAGLRKRAIEEIIRKYMQERRRKEKEPINGSDDQSDSSSVSSASSPDALRREKQQTYEEYFNKDLTSMAATSIILVWLRKENTNEIRLGDLKKEAKELHLRLLRNQDKETHIKAVASTLLRRNKVKISDSVDIHRITRDDVKIL